MKRLVIVAIALGLFSVGLIGCSEKESVKTETKVKTPGGTTTKTTETETKKTGDHKSP